MIVRCKYDELLPITKFVPHPKNRNKHPEDQIVRLAQIMEFQGVRRPARISKRSGFVTAGHGALLSAKLLGWETFPADYQDYETEEMEYADVQADNAIASWAEFDLSSVHSDLPNLQPFDIDLLGIKDFQFEPEPKEGDEDDVPEVVGPTSVRLGDLFLLGSHRLLCGDSTDKACVERLMNGEKADMVFTDPPYGMNLDAQYSNKSRRGGIYNGKDMSRSKGVDYANVRGDREDWSPALINTVFDSFGYCDEIFLFGADYYADILPNRNNGSWVVWDKVTKNDGEVSGISKFHGSNFELCWSKAKHKRDLARIMHKGLGSVENDKRVHPTQKPVKLAEWFLANWGNEVKLVADIYLGSGSTLIACEKTNRRCFGMEIDPHYCDVILDRWAKYTGKDPVREDGVAWSSIRNPSLTHNVN